MALNTTTTHSDILDPAAAEIFYSGFLSALEDGGALQFTNVIPSSTATLEKKAFGGVPNYAAHTETDGWEQQDAPEGYHKTYSIAEHRVSIELSYKDAYFWGSAELGRLMSQVGVNGGLYMDSKAVAVLTGGMDDAASSPDGSNLFGSDHAISGGTFNNRMALDLSFATLATATAILRKTPSHHGIVCGGAVCTPKYLVVPPELEQDAKQIVASAVTGADMKANVLGSGLQVVVSTHISDADSWFLLAADTSLEMVVAKGPSPTMETVSAHGGSRISDILLFANGYSDWRGCAGSTGAG